MSHLIPRIDYGIKTTNGDKTTASFDIINIDDTTDFVIGDTVKGVGIPFDTKIASKTTSTLTLDKALTSTELNSPFQVCKTFVFQYPPTSDTEWQDTAQGTQSYSLSGQEQRVVNYMESVRNLTFGFITSTAADLFRTLFRTEFGLGKDFHYYQDKAVNSYDVVKQRNNVYIQDRQAKKSAKFLYEIDLSIRKVVL